MRFRALLFILPLLAACSGWTDQVTGPQASKLPTAVQQAVGSPGLQDRYIVVFRDDVVNPSGLTDQLVGQLGGTVHFRYASAIKGFAATLPAAAIAGLQRNPHVSFIEPDGIVTVSGSGSDPSATWGLDRVDQRNLPLSGSYQWTHDGTGVTAYIIDTGIRPTHNEFGGRASIGADFIGDGRNGIDCHGHGTHVAGTVGGAEYGIARATTLVAVRVLNCAGSGSNGGVIAGIDWVRTNAAKPAVANMSLGGGFSSALNLAVKNAVDAGVVFVVAAGNNNANACNASPAAEPTALTVGATISSDARASYSNFGTCVDLFAPGSSITSAWNTTNTATNTISGTSMASPHVAGVAALYLSANPNASPAAVESAIEGGATPNKVTNPGTGSPNLLLYSLITGTPPVGNNPPTVSFTQSCTGLTCQFNATGNDDGTIVSYSWTFGDGSGSSAEDPSKTYATGGTFSVTVTVTDDDGATGFSTQNVTVSSGGGGGITLSAVGFKVKGVQHADLTWTGATGAAVDIYRNTVKFVTPNDGAHTDNINAKGGGSYTYRVCLTGTQPAPTTSL